MDKPILPAETFWSLPKVDLHRHLEGSLRLSTMMEIARKFGLTLPTTSYLRSLVQVQSDEEFSFRNFLSKFQTLRLFYRTPEIITRITREAIADAAADNLLYMELRFTPVALSREQGFPLGDVIDWVCASAKQASKDFGINTKLIVSVNRHEPVALAEEVAQLAIDRISQGIIGLDLAGNEAEFSPKPFAPLFLQAKQSGLHITIHAGEWSGAESVRYAIEGMGAERIGHGVRVMEDSSVVALARERVIYFEVCITSNYQTGVVLKLANHPLPVMFSKGLKLGIFTDDPSISQITLSGEYQKAHNELGISIGNLQQIILGAVQAAFLPEIERWALITRFREALAE
ncbi:MAG TPA: adenosine deaminase [Anaerolineaceae bacterium]